LFTDIDLRDSPMHGRNNFLRQLVEPLEPQVDLSEARVQVQTIQYHRQVGAILAQKVVHRVGSRAAPDARVGHRAELTIDPQ
jgi:hypothetical protein